MNKLTEAIDTLWYMAYGIIAGWGITFTLVVIALILLLVRTINLQGRIQRLENRQVSDNRDLSLRITKIDKNLP
jgi:uncharacterized membrane protein